MTASGVPTEAALTIVITTFNRSGYLSGLLESIKALDPAPAAVVVVDNASTDGTPQILEAARSGFPVPLTVRRLEDNTGGAGGFAAGIETALASGAQWLWLMDDDVEVLPGAVAALRKWTGSYECIHGRRYDDEGAPFFWQHRFVPFLGVHLPVRGNVFRDSPVFSTNVGCFEGMLISADQVRRIGLPDARYFINGDDVIYGWLASLDRPVAYVNDFVLRKVRAQRQIDLGIRHLNDSSDLGRFTAMRNRGHTARYLQVHGRYHRYGFALGTVLTAGKELLRLVAVERTLHGAGRLWAGWRGARRILRDRTWSPVSPLAVPEQPAQPENGKPQQSPRKQQV
ncbi:glycosyltransferase [Arthrobacter sp. zg-Y877]|uniref:glycosyltransferase n=1 Tax=Arthrobacter sp. zg-Y877 TaxID=3049074 RepID=UPI0025A35AAC|nr:glycosyltransferase [Arthrobacter sp. zg-Y877]MDM7989724.1 glycosyltransferase [Arthrobacter sp. zg-Y877]